MGLWEWKIGQNVSEQCKQPTVSGDKEKEKWMTPGVHASKSDLL